MYLFLSAAAAFLATYLVAPKIISFFKNVGITGQDIHKKGRPEVAEMGGFIALIGFILGMMLFIASAVFVMDVDVTKALAATLTITLITMIGMLDDLTSLLPRKKTTGSFVKKLGFRQRHKFLLPLPAAVPLMAVNAGVSTMHLPLFGEINLGVLYPLVIVPLAVFGAANATNMLAGLNGLSASLGVLLLGSLGIFAYIKGEFIAAALALIFAASLLAFLRYNWCPAKIFPGDSLDYTIGAVAASVAIIGNIERFALVAFFPWFIEFALKAKKRFHAESFGLLQKNGTLKAPDNEINSLTHIPMKLFHATEKKVVLSILCFEAVMCAIAFCLYL